VRFLADMGVDQRVVEWLRAAGHDALHLRDEGLHRLPDPQIFNKAIAEQRIVLTFDLDFGEIAALVRGRLTSVILFRLHDTRAAHVIERLASTLAVSAAALDVGAIVIVEESRHRVRQLPIRKDEPESLD
jgi:predicted nuclease of predicted toxin-antitoxin system